MLFRPQRILGQSVVCFTTSSLGGYSHNAYRSFNLGAHVGDKPELVRLNRARLQNLIRRDINKIASDVGVDEINEIKWLNQKHTNAVSYYNTYNPNTEAPCDAIVTPANLTPLVVMTADCLPIVLYCTKTHKIAAVHAGYKGLVNQILLKTLECFEDKNTVKVWIGPSIKQKYFQISEEILPMFEAYPSCIKADTLKGKYLINLAQIACTQFYRNGVKDIQISDVCTYQHPFCYSHRLATHHNKTQSGRMATIILKV